MKIKGLWWRVRFINESGKKEETIWVSDIKGVRDYYKYHRPKCKNVKIDPYNSNRKN